jgi:hypothetical protein
MGLTIAARAANAGHRVLFASLEMRPDQIGARLVAAAADMSLAAVRVGAALTCTVGALRSTMPDVVEPICCCTVSGVRAWSSASIRSTTSSASSLRKTSAT